MSLINPGTYEATPLDWCFKEIGEKQTPMAEILFSVQADQGSAPQKVAFKGFLTEKTKITSIKALIACGFRDNDLIRFCEGAKGAALDTTKPVSVVIEHETDTKSGKTYNRIRWVNSIGAAGQFAALASSPNFKASLAALNLTGDIMTLKQEMGIPSAPSTLAHANADLPF